MARAFEFSHNIGLVFLVTGVVLKLRRGYDFRHGAKDGMVQLGVRERVVSLVIGFLGKRHLRVMKRWRGIFQVLLQRMFTAEDTVARYSSWHVGRIVNYGQLVFKESMWESGTIVDWMQPLMGGIVLSRVSSKHLRLMISAI